MFWIVAAAVVLALAALAWWSSGRTRTMRPGMSNDDVKSQRGVAEHQVRQSQFPGPLG